MDQCPSVSSGIQVINSAFGDSYHPASYAQSSHETEFVSLIFRELSDIISRKYTIPQITFIMQIAIWNFVCVQRTTFRLDIIISNTISAVHKFRENILENLWNVSETPS